MKCNNCKLVEMLVMARNEKEVVYQCPKCKELVTIPVEQEEEIIRKQQEETQEYLSNN